MELFLRSDHQIATLLITVKFTNSQKIRKSFRSLAKSFQEHYLRSKRKIHLWLGMSWVPVVRNILLSLTATEVWREKSIIGRISKGKWDWRRVYSFLNQNPWHGKKFYKSTIGKLNCTNVLLIEQREIYVPPFLWDSLFFFLLFT
jgi:hypothetical protein